MLLYNAILKCKMRIIRQWKGNRAACVSVHGAHKHQNLYKIHIKFKDKPSLFVMYINM